MNVIKLEKELSERVKERIESQDVKSKEDENYRLPMPISVGYLGLKTQKDVQQDCKGKLTILLSHKQMFQKF